MPIHDFVANRVNACIFLPPKKSVPGSSHSFCAVVFEDWAGAAGFWYLIRKT
jgi:hypothetical protein